MKSEPSWLRWTEKDQGNSKAIKKNAAEPRQNEVLGIIFVSETLSDTADLATATVLWVLYHKAAHCTILRAKQLKWISMRIPLPEGNDFSAS